jgi:hypothetical protein
MYNSIYTIWSKTSNKLYVGFTSLTVEERWSLHVKDAKNPKNSHLHHAIKKYGQDDFIVDVIYQSTDRDHCHNVMEAHFIDLKRSEGWELYNIQPGGEGNKDPKTSKRVELYDADLKLVETLPSQSATARKLGCDLATVIQACRNAAQGKASKLKGYWACFEGGTPVKKDTSYMTSRNQRIRPNLGKKRPDHSQWMKDYYRRKKSLPD